MLRSVSAALIAEDRAFESLYRLHRPVVYAYALSTLRNVQDAEDVTQTTFLNAYCALHRGVQPRESSTWLVAIARNVCRDKFRDAKRRPREEPLADWTPAAEPAEPSFSLEDVSRELSTLNPRYREILLMREFEGRSYTEISEELGVSEAAAQALLRRARNALRAELELGMSCTQARRTLLRHLNDVATAHERRALQKHLRRCTDCATFAGRPPRTPIAHAVWLVTIPYRRLLTLLGLTSSTGTTAGATAIATKVAIVGATVAVAGGVTAKEVGTGTILGHSRRTPAPTPAPTVVHHSVVRMHPAPARVRIAPIEQLVRVAPAATTLHTARLTRAESPPTKRVFTPASVSSPSAETPAAPVQATSTPSSSAQVPASVDSTSASQSQNPSPAAAPPTD